MFYPFWGWPPGPGCYQARPGCGPGFSGCGFDSCGDGGFHGGMIGCGGIGGWRPGGCGPCAGYLSDRFGNGWNPGCRCANTCMGFLDGLLGFW